MSRLNDNPDYRQGNAASAGSGDDVMVTSGFKSSVTAKGWRKVLYDSPDSRLGDNYTPHQYFLDAIERNKNLHKYSLSECLVGSCQVALQIDFVLMFYLSYMAVQSKLVTSGGLLLASGAICVASYAFLWYATKSRVGFKQNLKRVLIFVSFGLGLSPLLHRLTETIATDTIYTTSGAMLFLHLVVHNYEGDEDGGGGDNGISALSLNAGLFASVCLASRLPTAFDGFALLSASVEAFALLPAVRKRLLRLSTSTNLWTTAILSFLIVTACHVVVSPLMAFGAAFAIFTITVLCPMLFLHWQSYKQTLHGPWDEAIPKFQDDDPKTQTTHY